MKPVQCHVSEVASLKDAAVLGTFVGILNAIVTARIIWLLYSHAASDSMSQHLEVFPTYRSATGIRWTIQELKKSKERGYETQSEGALNKRKNKNIKEK